MPGPLAALLARLGTLGSSLLAKGGLSTAAKQAIKQTTKSVVRRGAAAEFREVAEGVKKAGEVFRSVVPKARQAEAVIEDVPLGPEKARDLTRSLAGGREPPQRTGMPPRMAALPPMTAPRMPPRPPPLPGMAEVRPATPSQYAAFERGGRPIPTAQAIPQPPPGAAPPLPQLPGETPAAGARSAPSAGPTATDRSKGFFEDAVERAQKWQQSRLARAQERWLASHPVSQDVAGLTIEQRYQRLKETGFAPRPEDVARRFATPQPSQEQTVQHGEEAEQEARDLTRKRLETEREGSPVMVAKDIIIKLAKMTGAVVITTEALQRLATKAFMSSEHLKRFDAGIATAFAQLERHELILAGRQARATSGSTQMLGDQLIKLNEEMQPMREGLGTLKNISALALIEVARIAVFVTKYLPLMVPGLGVLQAIENAFKKGQAATRPPFLEFLDRIRAADFNKRKNK